MADHQTQASLEDQLRNMILTNVTIGSPDAARGHVHNQHHHPRGRGRGRGRARPYNDRGAWNGTSRGEYQHQVAPSVPPQHNMAPSQAPRMLPRPYDPNRVMPNPRHADHQAMPPVQNRYQNYQPRGRANPSMRGGHTGFQQRPVSDTNLQDAYLDHLAMQEIPNAEITREEFQEKEAFRLELEKICHEASIKEYAADLASIRLVMFGSLASGFATKGSDMDLAIVPEWKDASQPHNATIDRDIPRILEKAILGARLGGRLLTKTRVPILKVCQRPTDGLYTALFDERTRWDALPEEEKYPSPTAPDAAHHDQAEQDEKTDSLQVNDSQNFPTLQEAKAAGTTPRLTPASIVKVGTEPNRNATEVPTQPPNDTTTTTKDPTDPSEAPKEKDRRNRGPRKWQRERKHGPLDFPKSGVGIQCDINFSNPLALHNTHLLHCYSLTDPRVRPMVLFVKAWAKRRKINSAYSGTLSSYGWVLMVLHYLVNIVSPPVCPNLQSQWRPTPTKAEDLPHLFEETTIAGYPIRFWRDAPAISDAAARGLLTSNTQSIASLLRGFFHYYASLPGYNTYGQRQWCFFWATEVLSLRSPGGIRRKEEKGWTRATTTIVDGKEVRQRYLFSIEDPFEVDHNVARTVTHDGIVAIRDELRRAGRILGAVGRGETPEGGLFDEVMEQVVKEEDGENAVEGIADADGGKEGDAVPVGGGQV